MSTSTDPNLIVNGLAKAARAGDAPNRPKPAQPRKRRGDGRSGSSLFAHGEPMVWLSGGSLALCLVMIAGMLLLIVWEGSKTFWPKPVTRVTLLDGKTYMGEVNDSEEFELAGTIYGTLPLSMRDRLRPAFMEELDVKEIPTGSYILDAKLAALGDPARAALIPLLGPPVEKEPRWRPVNTATLESLPAETRDPIKAAIVDGTGYIDGVIALHPEVTIPTTRRLYRTGNFEQMNEHFHWLSDYAIEKEENPPWAIIFERESNGRFYGVPVAFLQVRPRLPEDTLEKLKADNVEVIIQTFQGKVQEKKKAADLAGDEAISSIVVKQWTEPADAWKEFQDRHPAALQRVAERRSVEKHGLGPLRQQQSEAKLDITRARLVVKDLAVDLEGLQRILRDWPDEEKLNARVKEMEEQIVVAQRGVEEAKKRSDDVVLSIKKRTDEVLEEIRKLDALNREYGLLVSTADGRMRHLEMADIVRAYPANQLGTGGKWGVYLSRWGEFFTADPREVNTEGGVFPAIFGTVVMTLVMTVAVVPFGVLAALYLREYAKAGPIVSAVRIAVNNLAGVPSIVFGVFGLAFFCYTVGKYIDGGPKHGLGYTVWADQYGDPWPWFIGLLLLIALVVGAIVIGWKTTASRARGASPHTKALSYAGVIMWVVASVLAFLLIRHTPLFNGFFRPNLEDNNPTFGTGGLMWASMTLALLTLPVVIVATEEALAAVPGSMREGSYACGASKWQTIKRIVLPRAMPGIMTGAILAMARGAGEVAPLMLVGVLKLAPELPIDGHFPFVHAERKFMHLGFHIYDVGFQSPNSKAAVPMVYTTTMLLILIIAALNVTAITLRSKLRRKFVSGHF